MLKMTLIGMMMITTIITITLVMTSHDNLMTSFMMILILTFNWMMILIMAVAMMTRVL
jgi:hypothetical protein